MQTLVEQPGFSILLDPATSWLHVTWQGTHTASLAQRSFEAILAQVRVTGSTKILNDARQDLDGWGPAVEWAKQTFFPQLATTGVVAFAWVTPQDLRAHIDMNKLLAVSSPVVVDAFTDVESACRWLRALPKTR